MRQKEAKIMNRKMIVSNRTISVLLALGLVLLMVISSYPQQGLATEFQSKNVRSLNPSMLPGSQGISPINSQGLSLDQSIFDRPGVEQYFSFDDAVGSFGNTIGDYQQIWEPWKTKAATHAVALSEDGQFLAVGTGYLSDNEVHIYRWNPEANQYVLVSVAGDGIIMSDVIDLSFGDVDNNGFIDLAVASYDGHVYLFEQAHVYDPSGSTENRFDLVWTSPRILKASSVVIYDADLDGFKDVIAGGWDGKIHVWEFRERTPYPFSREHTKYLKEVFVSESLGSPITALRTGDFDGDKLPEIIVGLHNGAIIIYENAGAVISTPNGPFPIAYDNYYVERWKNNETIWLPILDMEVDDIDKDGKTEAAVVAMGQDVFLLDNGEGDNEYILDKVVRNPANWEQHGAYPIDYYVDVLMNASNVFFNGHTSIKEPMDPFNVTNQVSPYTSAMANKSLDYYSLLRGSAGDVWALMDWGQYEEVVAGGNDEADIIIHLNSAYNGPLSNINLTFSQTFDKWVYLPTDNLWISNDKKTIYIDIDPIVNTLNWKFIRYMNMTLSQGYDMEILYWEAVRINLRLGDARSVMFSTIQRTGFVEKVLTVGISDGRFLNFEYNTPPTSAPWTPRMSLLYDSYVDQLFKLDTGGAWSIVPNPLHRQVPNWVNPQMPVWYNLSTTFSLQRIEQASIVPNLHPVFYLMGDDAEYDLVVKDINGKMAFIPDPYLNDMSNFATFSNQLFDDIYNYTATYGENYQFAIGDFLHFPWEGDFQIPEILISAYRPITAGFSGEGIGGSSYIRIYYLPDWAGNTSNLVYRSLFDVNNYPFGTLDPSGALTSLSHSISEPLRLGTGDFDGDGWTDVVASNGKELFLFRQNRPYQQSNGSLELVPGFFDGINKILAEKKYSVENIQGIDYDNDSDADVLISLAGRYGFTFFENVGNKIEPIWVEKRSFVHNREPATSFTNYNYELGLIWPGSKDFDAGKPEEFIFMAINDSNGLAYYQTSYDYQQSWVVATYPEVKIILTNFYSNSYYENYGFQYFEAWSNKLLNQNWTQALDVGILDGDNNKEIVVADYDNNLYVFEYLTNNTYKISYRSSDLVYNVPISDTPYESDVLIGMDTELNRTLFENGKHLVAGVDLNHNGLKEIVLATQRQIYWFEHTGYNDEYELKSVILLPLIDSITSTSTSLLGENMNYGISALEATNDLDGNGRGEILVGYNQYLLVFELSIIENRFEEVLGYDISGSYSNNDYLHMASVTGPGNQQVFPFAKINAILVKDINKDNYPEIIIGGALNYELNGYPGFLRILSMNYPNDVNAPYNYWKEVWNEKSITGFMERNYVTSLAVDDQNYNGVLDLIVGHAHGFDVFEVSMPYPTIHRITSVSGDAGYPITGYYEVFGYPDSNGTILDMYSSSIVRADNGYYYLAYSKEMEGFMRIVLHESESIDTYKQWNLLGSLQLTSSPGASAVNYDATKEMMPSITFSNGFWFATWLAFKKENSQYYNVAEIWIAATADFKNWDMNFVKVASIAFNKANPIYYTSPKLVPIPGSTPSVLLSFAAKGIGAIYFKAYTVSGGALQDYVPSVPVSVVQTNFLNFTYTNYSIHTIGITDFDTSDNIYEMVVSMKYIGENASNVNYDLWYLRVIPGMLNDTPSIQSIGNWTRITKTSQDEIFPDITTIGVSRKALIITYLRKGGTLTPYTTEAITGVGEWPTTWSKPSIIQTEPYSYHRFKNYNGLGPQNVFDARFMNNAFASEATLPDYLEYSYFLSKYFISGAPAILPEGNGYILAYPTAFYDYSHIMEFTFNVGDKPITIRSPTVYQDLYVLVNPFDSYAYTDISGVKAIDVGDTDKDGRREVGVAYSNTAEILELEKWDTSSSTYLYESIWKDTAYLTKDVRETTGIALFDSNNNGFEEIILTSRGGYVRSYEFSNLLMGQSEGSIMLSSNVLSNPGVYGSLDSAYWDSSSGVLVAGGKDNNNNYAMIRLYTNVNSTNKLNTFIDLFDKSLPQFDEVHVMLVDNTNKTLMITGLYQNTTGVYVSSFYVNLGNSTKKLVETTLYPGESIPRVDYGGTSLDYNPRAFKGADGMPYYFIPLRETSLIINYAGKQSSTDISTPGPNVYISDIGDMDSDGQQEILVIYDNNTLSIWELNGTVSKTIALANDVSSAKWIGITTADGNKDGINDIYLIRYEDARMFGYSGSDGTQMWNVTITKLTSLMFFEALTSQGETSLFIAGRTSTHEVMSSYSLKGLLKWVYTPTNDYYFIHDVTYDEMKNKFILVIGDTSDPSTGGSLVVSLNFGGAVEGITKDPSYNAITDITAGIFANSFLVFMDNTITIIEEPEKITIYDVEPNVPALESFDYFFNAEGYKVLAPPATVNAPSILYSITDDIIALFSESNGKINIFATFNFSNYDFTFDPVFYTNNDVLFLVLANSTHLTFFNLEDLYVKGTVQASPSGKYVQRIFSTDFEEDGTIDVVIITSTKNPGLFYFYSNHGYYMTWLTSASFEPANEVYIGTYSTINKVDWNQIYIGFTGLYVSFFSANYEAKLLKWSSGIVSVKNYTDVDYVNIALPPLSSAPDTVFLLDNDGNVYADTDVGTPGSYPTFLQSLPEILYQSQYDSLFYTESAARHIDVFKAYLYDNLGTYEPRLIVVPEYSDIYLFSTSSLIKTKSYDSVNTKLFIPSVMAPIDTLFMIHGKYIQALTPNDLETIPAQTLALQGYVEEYGSWNNKGKLDLWTMTTSNSLVFYSLEIDLTPQYAQLGEVIYDTIEGVGSFFTNNNNNNNMQSQQQTSQSKQNTQNNLPSSSQQQSYYHSVKSIGKSPLFISGITLIALIPILPLTRKIGVPNKNT